RCVFKDECARFRTDPYRRAAVIEEEIFVNVYEGKNIRNVGIVGHGGSGKTSLISASLFDTGATNRLGRVDDGNAPTDYEDEEIERKITMSVKFAFCEWNKNKINMLDTPGFGNFIQEARGALRVADAAIVVVDAVSGAMVQTEKDWAYADRSEERRVGKGGCYW